LYSAIIGRVGSAVSDAISIASDEPTLADQVVAFIRVALSSEH
jgi:hypothetical protein